jgi:hypothetical protein
MDSYQHEYDFSVDDAVKKWRTLTANDGILLEKEFQVRFRIVFIRNNHFFFFLSLDSTKIRSKSCDNRRQSKE